MRDPAQTQAPLALVESVRCLECGAVYARPAQTRTKHPGCPECGYVGWLSVSVPVSESFGRRRSAAGRRRRLRAQRR